MHVLTTRGGELATVFPPLCERPGCGCSKGGIGLDSGRHPVDEIIVAERDDLTLRDLKAACAHLLQRTGWTDEDGEIAEMMAGEAADIAEVCEPGTRLWARFNRATEDWEWYDEDPSGPLMLTEVL